MRTLCLLFFAALSIGISAQTVSLRGNVTDSSGEPVIEASVLEKGTMNGVITDLDGNFQLNVSGDLPLVISYIGMRTQEITVKGKTTIQVILEDDAQALDEVVVVGYEVSRKKDLTGSVSTVGGNELAKIPVTSAAAALTGKVAGVTVSSAKGSPDAEVKIRVRGGGSITQDNSPLYIVDGFPVNNFSVFPWRILKQ
ncbi:MAG: carboxypeptidase-like regulatory domain-containing protein [Bacteroides sp.]|nr:carboxypeptidase-like regulatory domain-containing protein [Bacteroides sp.]